VVLVIKTVEANHKIAVEFVDMVSMNRALKAKDEITMAAGLG